MFETTYNDWTLVSLSPLPLPWRIAGAALVLLAVAWVLWSYRQARRRWLLVGLRLAGALLILGLLTEPAVQLRVVRKIRNRLAIVIDRSASMGLATHDGKTRLAHARAVLERDPTEWAALSDSHVVELHDLDGPTNRSALNTSPRGNRTDLLSGLEQTTNAGAGRPLAGIILLSDGADNVGLEGNRRGVLSPTAVKRLEALGVPVNAVDAGSASTFKDVGIVDIRVDEFAFVHNSLEIEVLLETTGYESVTVPVTLKREEDVLATQEASLRDTEITTGVFVTKPDQIGSFVYSVSVPQLSGESITTNNSRSFVLQVVRDKIRVLQVAGRPSWDERFLRQHLKQNPNVDLVSFFILRTPTDVPGAPESELSLIPFPVDKLFTTELSSFDVVVFQNFDYRPYNMAQYLPNIRDAVHKGLGFVMLGGPQSFSGGDYAGTALEDIVPLRLESGDFVNGRFRPVLTNAGRNHPVTNLARSSGQNDRLWRRLPEWSSVNRSPGLAPTATALVEEQSLRGADGRSAPLMATMDTGEGRSLAIATDSMWRWRFWRHQDGGAAERAYHRFWSNALHWLVRDPEHSRVRMITEKRRFDLDEPVDLSFSIRDRDYRAVPFSQLQLTLEQQDVGLLRSDELNAGETGQARQRYAGLKRGAYRVTARATAGGEELGTAQGVFLVDAQSDELGRGAPRPDLLQAVADKTDGRYLPLSADVPNQIKVIDPDVVEVNRRRNLELWDNVWALVFAVALLALEWAFRRRTGYL